MKANWLVAALLGMVLAWGAARSSSADTFGNGANSFEIEFVTIGNPRNPPDTTGSPSPAGGVPYEYRIGKYEISEQMIDAANALGGLGITKDTRGPNKPATTLTWYNAARFVNWLNASTGNAPAYKFDSGNNFQLWTPLDPGYDANNLYRNKLAKYFLPSADEWYKAAYYDPQKNIYYVYPTGSNSPPDGVDFPGDRNFDAVFFDGAFNATPNDITDVGVVSPFGTAGQGGNAAELEETDFDLVNDSNLTARGFRGGFWASLPEFLSSSSRRNEYPADFSFDIGFRIASVIPEPSTLLLGGMMALCLLPRRRADSRNGKKSNSNQL